MKLLAMLFFIFLFLQSALAKNPYLQQIKQTTPQQEPDKKLHQRITRFVQKKTYTIKNLPSFHKQNNKLKTTTRSHAPAWECIAERSSVHNATLERCGLHSHRNDGNERGNLCQSCHSQLPHSKNTAIRAFLNQHSQRIDCLTCHYQAKNIKLDYQWFKQDNLKYIAPYYHNKSLVILAQNDFSQQIKQQWDKADIYQKARLHLRLHQPLNFNQHKIQCGDCHRSNGLLNLQALGFNDKERQKIETNLVSRFVQKLQAGNAKNNAPILLRGLLQ